MSRTVPLTGLDEDRLFSEAHEKIFANEIHTTKLPEGRVFLEGEIVAPVAHGDVASEAAMLALNTISTRGCHRSDWCKRTDINALAICKSNRGTSLSDWEIIPITSSSTGGYGDNWGFVIEGDDLCIEFDTSGNPFIAIEEIT